MKIAHFVCARLVMSGVLLGLALPASGQAVKVKKAAWIDAMSTALPAAFCNPRQYFRQCFRVTARECERAAASATRICLDKNKDRIPAVLNQPQDGRRWGATVGSCAGQTYEISLIKKRIDSKRCNDPANWR